MRAFLTGATGFIGGHVARLLRERGDEVVALVRSPSKASALSELGCELVQGDLSDEAAIRKAAEGCDAAFHVAASYKVGIPKKERPAMHDANVGGTERVIDACTDAGVAKIVYVSTCGVFSNTHGKTVDEDYEHPGDRFLSTYEETKYLAHKVAQDRIAKGAPVVIVQPGGVYGPNDHSDVGTIIEQAARGRMPLKTFPDTGLCLSHVEDIAQGIVLAHDRGEVGRSYVLSGPAVRMGDVIDKAAALGGKKPPRFTMPARLVRLSAPLGPLIGPLMGYGPNLRELVDTSDGVTYWASDARARSELGWETRPLDDGLRETVDSILGR